MKARTKAHLTRFVSLMLAVSVLMLSACTPATSGTTTSGSGSGTSASASSQSAGNEETLKIACLYNITGSGADTGVMNMAASQLAVKHINESGGIKSLGGMKLELIVGDTMSDTSQAKAVAERVLATPGVVAGVGVGGSGYTISMQPVFERMEIPLVQMGVSNSITNQGYKYTFRPVPSGGQFGNTQVEFLAWLNKEYDMNITKIGIIYENSEYGLTTAQGNREIVENAGLEVVFDEAFPVGASDVSSLIVGLKSSGAQAVFPVAFSQDAKLLFNTMKSMNYYPVIVGGGAGFLFPAFADELGEEVDGVVSVASNSWDTKAILENPALQNIPQEYEETYGHFMSEHAVGSYNDVYIIAQGLEACGSTNPKDLRDAIVALDVPTLQPAGNTKFNDDGSNPNAEAIMIQWQKSEDGIYRPRTVFPLEAATAEYQQAG